MEEKIIAKIEEVVDYIISKPASEVTLNDYTILHEELKENRFRRDKEISDERIKQLMECGFPFAGFGSHVK